MKSKPKSTIKFIYNPNAGAKRRIVSRGQVSLEMIKDMLEQYQIQVDYYPTKYPKHATKLAQEAQKEGYDTVLVAGGDGTVGEAANGLFKSKVKLGIIPLGTYMNVAKMLSIPQDTEKAVLLLKVGRTRKLDLGCVTKLGGEKMEEPYYFIEGVGLGLEAQMQKHFLDLERGDLRAVARVVKTLFEYYGHRAYITLDNKQEILTRATLITISNGPFTGANLKVAPVARLNDHMLTVTLFNMTKWELIRHFFHLFRGAEGLSKHLDIYQAKRVKLVTRKPRLVHVDARLFGETPVEFSVIPNALEVICGFPDKEENALLPRTYLDP